MVAQFASTQPGIQVNREQIAQHLAVLGYKGGDTVYLRSFYKGDDPRKQDDKGRSAEVRNLEQLIKTVTAWQSDGRGVYFVVNGGGQADRDVTTCRAIFYEHDHLDKELQKQLWRTLSLPEPSLQIDTGGKSIHSYWILDSFIEPLQWKQLQTDLLEYADADRALKNPSRVMRLAGCWHFGPNNVPNGQSQIILNTELRYSYEQLRATIPTTKREMASRGELELPFGDVPLYQCLSKDDRALIDSGAGIGERNNEGAKLARNLIGTANRLTYLGYTYSGDPRNLFDDYCHRCSPPVDAREADSIWKSASKDNPTATLSDDAIVNCIKAWQKNQNQGTSPYRERAIASPASPASQPNNVVPHPTFVKQMLSGDELLKEIDLLIDANIGGAQLQANLLDLAAKAGRTLNEVSKLYNSREQEEEFIFERETATRSLPTLLEAQKAQLSPQQVLWGDGGRLAQLIQSTGDNMPVSPEALLTTLFPVASSRIGTSSRLVINPKTNYTVTSIFWSCVVSKTGTLKTPAQKVIINPLNKLESQEYQNWKVAIDDYNRALKQSGKGDSLPEPPEPRKRFIIQGSTTEARMKIHGENPRGLLYHRDEWVSFITGRNKYRSGKGDDAQLDLSEFNGDALYKDVVDSEKCIFLEQSAISRTGNTQPEILKQFQSQGDFADYAGEFARWLYCLKENPLAFIDLFQEDDGTGQQFYSELSFLYQHLGKLPERDYFLSDDAKRIYQKYQHQLMQWLEVEEHPGLAATYPKLQTYLGRFALWLHLVNAVLAGESTPVQFINGRTMQAAVKCTEFYLAQARLLYALNSDQNTLAGNLLKIKDYIEKHPVGVSIRQIKQGIKALKKVPSALIEQDCQALLSSGLIQKVAKVYQSVIRKTVGPVGQLLTGGQHNKNVDLQELDKNVGPVDPFFTDFLNPVQGDGYLRESEKPTYIEETVNNGQPKVETQPQQDVDPVDPSPTDGQQTANTVNENTDTPPSNLDNCGDDEVAIALAPVFQVGDVVAAADPYEVKYTWLGTVKQVKDNGEEIVVYWSEREGTALRPDESHEASYLRLISRGKNDS